jgi:hypothetical protein
LYLKVPNAIKIVRFVMKFVLHYFKSMILYN